MPKPLIDIKNTQLYRTLLRLGEADVLFWIMPPLMLLLVAGTIAQRWIGLHAAHQMFFSSFIVWWGPLPLPGGFTLMAILSFCLGLKFLLKSEWSLQKSGIILTHLSVLVLLFGGLLTAITARESFMIIPEGQETPFIYDYNARSLVVYENGAQRLQLDFAKIEDWQTKTRTLPFDLKVVDSCQNCAIEKPETPPDNARSMARFMVLSAKKSELEPEANLSGATLDLSGIAPDIDGRYIVFDGMPKAIEFIKDGRSYALIFGKNQTELPFSIALVDFQKQLYGGTDTAKSYASDLVIKDKGGEWPVRIEMNKPLRYRGYTFFQSNFEETPEYETTILAVVENEGWLFPYVGTFGLALGLLLHMGLSLRTGRSSS
jgi:hypothetical protein